MLDILLVTQLSNSACFAAMTSLSQSYACINQGSAGLISFVVEFVLFIIFALVMLFRDTEVEVAGLVSSVILVMISSLAEGISGASSASFGNTFGVFIFGAIAIVCFLLVAFRGATKSY